MGFSLSFINNTLKLLDKNPIIFKFEDLKRYLKKANFKGKFVFLLKFIFIKLFRKDRLKQDIKSHRHTIIFKKLFIILNEDVIYGYYIPKYCDSFNVGNFHHSSNFCIDWNVKKLLKKISPAYPFDARAWFTYPENFNEWKKHIEEIK